MEEKTDPTIKRLLDESDKAEFLETFTSKLHDCRRAVICFESPTKEEDDSVLFEYYQIGFRQTYEILGFLNWIMNLIEAEEE